MCYCRSLPGSSILLLSSGLAGALADSKKKLLKEFLGLAGVGGFTGGCKSIGHIMLWGCYCCYQLWHRSPGSHCSSGGREMGPATTLFALSGLMGDSFPCEAAAFFPSGWDGASCSHRCSHGY